MATIIDLGQKVKAKYPGAYDDLSDAELGKRVKQKYPGAYSDFTDVIPQSKTLLEKASNVVEKTMGKAANFMFGSTAKTVGGLVVGGVESAKELITGKAPEQRKGFDVAGRGETLKPLDVAFTTLELYPGGGFASEFLKSLPGGKAVAEVLSKVPEGLREKAIKQYSQALGATKEGMKYLTEKVTPGLLKRGVKATTREGLLTKVQTGLGEAGKELEKVLATIPSGARIKTKPILDALEQSKQQFIIKGTKQAAEPSAVAAVDDLKDIVTKFGDEVSFESLNSLRSIWDKTVSQAGGFMGKTLKEGTEVGIKKEVTSAIRNELAKEFPDLAKVNAEFTFWKRAETVLKETIKRTKPQTGILTKSISSLAGAGAGFSSGDDIVSKLERGFLGAFLGKKALDLFSSPGYKMISAVEKQKLADYIASGNIKEAELMIGKLLAGVKNLISPQLNKK